MKKRSILGDLQRYLFRDRLSFYIQLLLIQVIAYTIILYYSIPYLEGTNISWLSSVLFVLQTMTTVGYDLLTFFPAENPVTIILIIVMMCTGVFTFLMIIPAVLTPYIQDVFRPSPPSGIHENISGHVIVAGYNEISKSLIDSLLVSELKIVLVEEDEKKGLLAMDYFKKYKKYVRVISGSYDDTDTWYVSGRKNQRQFFLE